MLTKDHNRDSLLKLTKDQLFQICLDNNITVKKSTKKSLIIDDIIKIKEDRGCLQKKLVDDNPFHRSLPVLIITKILEYCWRISTSDRVTPLIAYEEALKLTLINKRFYGIVSRMFNNVKLSSTVTTSRMGELHKRLSSVWCPIKHIVKLQVEIPIFEQLMKQPSVHLTHMLSTVEKLFIYQDYKWGHITETSIKTFVTIATNLHSLSLYCTSVCVF
ncbi:hypothetical protein PPL_03426 [Heterostelium album PN500]|uniref:Uncharacterized protein n=1 Tax=Heterostelium pallidum (strain ATCC 26659 / Pp 5 / PN500) TaxID=670386 RepID=D3B4V0_HETP5|nr:hypothetical protein PPL_03426 [Heterostelium album PN500]EFA84348.1 hypothetical protein PPL_03426 [Heterostelium album PN500]|eukprot:XP_020436463.1 hypothetical protein PPL_03426 [Heterostelium album PN500]